MDAAGCRAGGSNAKRKLEADPSLSLCRNNPLLVGPAGVGKTAIVEGLAQKIVAGEVPESLKNKRLISIDLSTLMSGVRSRPRELFLRVLRLISALG